MEQLLSYCWSLVGGSGNHNEKPQDEFDAFFEEELQRRPEVRIINKYVVVMAYVRIGLKGIGALMLLWATVVLLGGFVSDLMMTDFWCLTIIAFIQAAGLSDAMGDARLESFRVWIVSLVHNITSWGEKHHDKRTQLTVGRWVKRQLHILRLKITDIALALIFIPVVYFAAFGPILCVTLSALRVAKQDYGISKGDTSKANLKPALNLFYCVSLAQSAISFFCMIRGHIAERDFVNILSHQHRFSPKILRGYLDKTKQMCLNNPASTMSWNLIAYGADLLDSQLPEDYASGGRVLTMLIDQDTPSAITWLLIRSPRQRIQKLIGTLAWVSPAEQEMRWLAVRIVEHLSGHLNLSHFSGALECISSLFHSSCHNSGDQEALCLPFVIGRGKRKIVLQKWKHSASENGGTLEQDGERKESGEYLVLSGLRILENLAHDRRNCTLIYNTKDLLSKIVAPVSSKELVQDIKSNPAWTKVVDGSLKVVGRLIDPSGSTNKRMCKLIANNSNAVKNLEAILDMDMKSNSGIIGLQMRAIEVLTQLALHHPTSTSATKRRENLFERVLHIFVTTDWMEDYLKEDEKRKIVNLPTSQQMSLSRQSMGTCMYNFGNMVTGAKEEVKKAEQAAKAHVEQQMKAAKETASRLKEKAGEALAMLSGDSEAIKSFTGCKDNEVGHLTELLNSKTKTIDWKTSATDTVRIEINIGCRISAAVILKHLSNYDKEPTLRMVLTELLPMQAEACSTTTPRCWERAINCIKASRNDIENPSDAVKDEPSTLQSHHIQQCGERRLQAELLSLITTILSNSNLDLAAILMSQTPPVVLEDFVVRLKKMVEDNMYATPACLAMQKLTCEMVMEFIQHDENVEMIDKHDIVGTLLEASETMVGLESSMLFAGVDRDCHGVPLKPLSSVLAKNTEDLLAQRKQALGINIAPASASAP